MEDVKLIRKAERKVSSPPQWSVTQIPRPRQSTVIPGLTEPFFRVPSFESSHESVATFRPLLTSLTNSFHRMGSEQDEEMKEKREKAREPRTFSHSVSNITRRQTHIQILPDPKLFESTLPLGNTPSEERMLSGFLDIRPKTPFEVVDGFKDQHCLLEIRKALMRIWQALRQICKIVTTNSLFQTFIILAILLNTVLLALEDPSLDVQPEPYLSMETSLLYIYSAEMGLKIIAMGFVVNTGSYIRDPWNILDFIVVVSGWIELEYGGSGINLSALRALRILRPLRTIKRIKGMKIVFLSLVNSAKDLFSSVMLLIFFYLITAIAALQMFMGVLKHRCMNLESGSVGSSWDDSNMCGGSRSCSDMEVCVKGLNNPNYGKSHFDNVLMAMLTIFQSVTLEGWTPVMNALEKSMGMFVVIFYIPIVLLGAFFFMNMTLVAMKTSFTKVNEKVTQGKAPTEDNSDEESEKPPLNNIDESPGKPRDKFFDNAGEKIPTIEGTPRILSKSVTINHNPDFFPIDANEKQVKMRQSMVELMASPRIPSIGSDDSLLVSKDNHSLSSHEHEHVAQQAIPTSPLLSETPLLSVKRVIDYSPLEIATGRNGVEILHDDPVFTEHAPQYTLLVPKLTCAFSEHQLSSQMSSVPQVEISLPLISPQELLLKMTSFSKKMKKVAKSHTTENTAWSLIESAELKLTAKSDVLQVTKEQIGEDSTSDANRTEFFYVEKAKDVQLSAKVTSSDGELESPQKINIEKRPFAQFLKLCTRFTSKEAYIKTSSLGLGTVMRGFVSITQKEFEEKTRIAGEWSGEDVKPTVEDNEGDKEENSEEQQPIYEKLNQFKYIIWQRGWFGRKQKFQAPFRYFIETNYFNIFFTVCVVLNTIVLAINHYGIDQESSSALDTCNLVFTIIFCVEMVLKMTGLGIIGYFSDKMNIFDFIVITLSLVELSFMSGSGLSAIRVIRVFRAFRALRVARLFRSMKYMQKILKMIGESIENFMYMGLLLFLFMVVFALFGMQLFGGKFDFDDGKPRSNYDNFHYSFLTTFQILTMENWFQVLYSGMRTSMGNYASLYFVLWIFFGNFVLLNLFLAILLDSFSNLSDDDDLNLQEINNLEGTDGLKPNKSGTTLSKRKQKKIDLIMKKIEAIKVEESLESISGSVSMEEILGQKERKKLFVGNECEKSYFLLRKTSVLRTLCFKITSSSKFELGIMFLIFISSLKLIWETYLFDEPAGSLKTDISDKIDLCFTILFLCEFLLKSISLGFVLGKGTYLRDAWNILDFIIVLFALVDIMTSGVNLQIIKVFRLLRALRPLRFISHNKSMRIIVNALLESLGALANVSVVILIVWLIFAILGVTLLMGKEYSCSNSSLQTESECLYYGYQWVNSPNNFDNVLVAYQSLFIMTSQENWPDQMYQGTDAYDTGQAMQTNCNPFMAYFFVVFEMVSNIFFLNLLLGVMFDKFEKAKRSNSSISELLLQNDQLRWVEMMKLIIRTKREQVVVEVTHYSQLIVRKIIGHWTFDTFIMGCIVGNMFSMAIAYDEASLSYTKVLENLNLTFTCVFCLEATLKIYGLSPKGYFGERWNCFDFFVVLSSLLDIILNLTVFSGGSNKMLTIGPQLARTLRILRVSRLLRLVKRLRTIDELVGMMALSIPAIMNVLALLVLLFTIFGVLGVYLFHGFEDGIAANELNNFSNFGFAVLLLVRASTGEDWNYLEWDASQHTNSIIATIYFQIFVSLTTFIMYNMFIMVMLQEYESYKSNPNDHSISLFKARLKEFNQIWNKCMPSEKRGRMDADSLFSFAYEMGERIGVKPSWPRFDLKKHLNQLGLVLDEQGFIFYHEVLFRCFRYMTGNHKRIPHKVQRKLVEKEEFIQNKKIRKLVKMDKLSSVTKFMVRPQGSRGTGDVQLMDFIFLKSVFRSWKGYTKDRKEQSEVSMTPPMSFNQPGVNTPELSEAEEKEEGEKEEKIRRTSQQTLQAPNASTEASSARDIKMSRTSTNYSRPRTDTQE